MALCIQTFSNVTGGDSFFKAVGHPRVVGAAKALIALLAAQGPIAIYDPYLLVEAFAERYPLLGVHISSVFVQNLADVGKIILGRPARPVSDLPRARTRALFATLFDVARAMDHIRQLIPPGTETHNLDELRLPEAMLTNSRRYLDPLNFATNFAFFRDDDRRHTRVVTANYWSGYGARHVRLWLALFDREGRTLAQWQEPAPPGAGGIVIDSQAVRRRFALGPFEGQLFAHVIGAAGHDVVKYALDLFGENPAELSCTHDANAWPADLYAGLPAPCDDESVILWVQNSHPCPIPKGAIGLNVMGSDDVVWL